MHDGEDIPLVDETASLEAALLEMTGKGLGMTGIVDAQGSLTGIYTDGDLRRTLSRGLDLEAAVTQVMTREPRVTTPDTLAAEVVNMMQQKSFNSIIAVDPEHRPVGALNMHDLLKAGLL